MMNDLQSTNMAVSMRPTAASSLITSAGYRRLIINRAANKHEYDWNINFQGSVSELMNRATYSGSGDSLTSTDHRGALGGGPVGRNVYLQDMLTQGTTGSSWVIYAREVSGATNAADMVLEGDEKPEQSFDLEEITAKVGKAAVFMRTTEETLSDYQNLHSFIEGQLVRRVKLAIENEILNGTGTAPRLIVGFQEVGLPTVSVGTAGSMLEALQESVALIESNGFTPSFIALNPTDKRALYSAKSAVEGLPMISSCCDGSVRIHGVPVLGSSAVAAGTGLIGDGSEATIMYHSGIGGSIYPRTETTNKNEDDFVNNLCTIRADARAALVIQSLSAFVEIVA